MACSKPRLKRHRASLGYLRLQNPDGAQNIYSNILGEKCSEWRAIPTSTSMPKRSRRGLVGIVLTY